MDLACTWMGMFPYNCILNMTDLYSRSSHTWYEMDCSPNLQIQVWSCVLKNGPNIDPAALSWYKDMSTWARHLKLCKMIGWVPTTPSSQNCSNTNKNNIHIYIYINNNYKIIYMHHSEDPMFASGWFWQHLCSTAYSLQQQRSPPHGLRMIVSGPTCSYHLGIHSESYPTRWIIGWVPCSKLRGAPETPLARLPGRLTVFWL